MIHYLIGERFYVNYLGGLLDDYVIIGHILFDLCIDNGHLAVAAPDDLILRHIGYGVLCSIVNQRIYTVLRVAHGIAQGLGELKGIRYTPQHIAVDDHRLLVGCYYIRRRKIVYQYLSGNRIHRFYQRHLEIQSRRRYCPYHTAESSDQLVFILMADDYAGA